MITYASDVSNDENSNKLFIISKLEIKLKNNNIVTKCKIHLNLTRNSMRI